MESKEDMFQLLIVEDEVQAIQDCRDAVTRYNESDKGFKVELIECRNMEEFRKKMTNNIDGAIIDLKLSDQGEEGNQVIQEIKENYFRIPIAILTGRPGAADGDFVFLGVYTKSELDEGYYTLLDEFRRVACIARIIGKKGAIEKHLDDVFNEVLCPQKEIWMKYAENDSDRTEKILLRYTLNHLIQILNNDEINYFPEEVYLHRSFVEEIWTGAIVEEREGNRLFVVMNPACDLVIREGKRKADRILVVEIDIAEEEIKKARGNRCPYLHWLPPTEGFKEGALNFRKLLTYSIEDYSNEFEKPFLQISPPFVKDIVARFSAYYARQGQPEIDGQR